MTKPSLIKIISLVIASILLVSAIGFSGYYYFKYSVNAGDKEVVDFEDMTKEEIQQYLIDNSIKEEYVVFEEEFDEEVTEGKVISQSILPGEGKFKDILTVVISKGIDPDLEVQLPEVDDFMQSDIEKWFEDNHFTNVVYQFIVPEDSKEEIPYGKVIALSKIGLAKRSEEIIVTLADEKVEEENEDDKLTTNEEDNYVTIIDFKGYSLDQFVDWVHSRGLKYYVYEVYSDDYKKGEVMSQSPKVGEKAKKGSTVTLRMSLGQAKKLENLVGKTEADAKKYATDNGLKIKINEEYSRTVEKGKIISTNPEAGKNFTEGDTLTITISKGSDVIALGGSYVGKAESELVSAVKAKYSSASFSKTESYSDKASGQVISHDSQISLINKFTYSVSLGQYADSSNYANKSINDVQAVVNSANAKGAGVSLDAATYEDTTDSSLNNKIKSCTFSNKTYKCTVYSYKEPSSTFVASDFANKSQGSQSFTKDGYTYNITVNITYTDYNNQEAGSFNSATCSTGNIIKNNSVVTVVLNKGPKPVVYGGEITWNIYSACEIPDDSDNPTFEKVKSAVIEKLTNSTYQYLASQINCVPDDSTLVGLIDIDNSTQGKKIVGEDTITVRIGTKKRGE